MRLEIVCVMSLELRSAQEGKKERWQAESIEMQPVIATFLNHSHPSSYWALCCFNACCLRVGEVGAVGDVRSD